MTPCLSCNRHVREEICPFCGSKCVQAARISLGRVARGALFAAGAVALTECSSSPAPVPFYGASCTVTDACVVQPDGSMDAGDSD